SESRVGASRREDSKSMKVRLIAKLAQALAHAHQRGILHRDLKPSNVLIDREGEPHLTDFGLARIDDFESGSTRTHAMAGPPQYMSPEQAAGHLRDLTTASDLFSLGAVFYHLLTGRQAFTGPTAVSVMHAVRETAPPRPRTIDSTIDRDLETICLKCLE